jgi:hypothetical protein
MIGYGLGENVKLYFTTWIECIVLVQSVKETLCGHYKMSRIIYCKMKDTPYSEFGELQGIKILWMKNGKSVVTLALGS